MNDPYVYKNSDVLINKLNIKDKDELEKTETQFVIFETDVLKQSNFSISSIHDCLKIHKFLFCDIYEWAGKPRTIDIFKGESLLNGTSIDYVFASYIDQALKELDDEFQEVKWDALTPKDKIEKICYFITEFWHIHPFREGNTRTTALMLYFLIKKANLHININFLTENGKYFRNALVLNCLYSKSKPEYLLGIVTDSVTLKNISKNKYETIDGYEVNKYAYTHHTVDKIKTIEKPNKNR